MPEAVGNHLITLAMASDLLARRRRRNLVVGVLAVGMIVSTVVAIALFYMSRSRPHF